MMTIPMPIPITTMRWQQKVQAQRCFRVVSCGWCYCDCYCYCSRSSRHRFASDADDWKRSGQKSEEKILPITIGSVFLFRSRSRFADDLVVPTKSKLKSTSNTKTVEQRNSKERVVAAGAAADDSNCNTSNRSTES